ncbi:hypothetical protein JOY44_13115 [Phormidium sp. CLA17]|uniref:hypothetical protein n=1 Tax=Leptolyngbya sp. Cla-17 TaxID=2803751 RepID=UPI001492463C|nr:hypothetical protein [Leptolyngbya sp. Cla-17]MBM0742545.1 hypothetical protein [Leptolyngbya sp. Cla-17]
MYLTQLRSLAIVLFTSLSLVFNPWFTASAQALVQIKLSEISYHACSAELAEGTVTSGSATAASCFIVTGKTENTSGKPVINADIFGRIYDANDNSIMENRTRLGSIEEVPPGVSDFELRITVPANQPPPLKLEQFKAAGFTGKVRR